MTLQNLLAIICFTLPLGMALDVGMKAGVVGVVIGVGLGLVGGGLAFYVLMKSVYSDALIKRVQSQPQFVQRLIETVAIIWIILLIMVAGLLSSYLTKFIIQESAGAVQGSAGHIQSARTLARGKLLPA